MSRIPSTEDRLVQYLLGLMPEQERVELEDLYLLDDNLNLELQAAERELMDRYLDRTLSETERNRFENFFMQSPGRMEKLRFARALKAYGAKSANKDRAAIVAGKPRSPSFMNSFRSYSGAAAFAVVVIVLGIIVWRFYFFRSPEEQTIIALTKACQSGRLSESRISGLPHSPMAQNRGNVPNLDQVSLRQAELIASQDANDHPAAGSFHTLGRVYLADRKISEALRLLRKASEADPEDPGIQSDLGAALLEQGHLNSNPEEQAQELAQSFDHLTNALRLNDSIREARFNLALWYEYRHLTQRAKEEWQKYLQTDSTSGWAAEARQRLARLEEKQSHSSLSRERDPEEFLAAARAGDEATAWAVLRRNRDRTGNTITQRLVDRYLEAGQSASGRDQAADASLRTLLFAGALELEKSGDRFAVDLAAYYVRSTPASRRVIVQGRRLLQSGFELYRKSEFESAGQSYDQAEVLFRKAGDDCEALVARSWVGACHLRIPEGAQAKALTIFQRLSALCTQRSYRQLLAHSLNCIAEVHASRREFSKSLENAARSTEIYESIQDFNGQLRSVQARVLASQQCGDFYKSIGFAIHGLDVMELFSPGPLETWTLYHQIAANLNSLGRPAAALEFQEVALGLAFEADTPLLKSRSYALQASIYQKLRRQQDAVKYGELALGEAQAAEGEKVRTNLIANSTLNLAHLYREMGAFAQALTRYNQAIDLHKRMNLDIYVTDAHRGKLQSLIALNDEQAISEEIKTSISLLESDRPRILEESNRNSYFDLAQSTYDLAIDFTLAHLHDSRTAFNYSEASHGRSLLDLLTAGGKVITSGAGPDVRVDGVAHPLNLTDIQRRLPERSQILQYSVLENRVIAWVISRDSVECAYQAVTIAEIREAVAAFLTAITKRSDGTDQEVAGRGRALYDILIKPVKALLRPDALVFIVPDKILNGLPFGALVSPESGKYFIEDYLFEIVPSSSIMIRCSELAREKNSQRVERLLAVGNPSIDLEKFPGLPDLPSAAREASSIAALYGTFALTGREAQARVVKARIADADVFQFAGHYVVDERSPLLSRLLLAAPPSRTEGNRDSDTGISPMEVYGTRLARTRLVVLSACGTGVEREYRGEGAIGMARSFIEAGVPVVVASLWPVDSEQTAQLMVDFHRRRKLEGMRTAQALRRAQLDMLNGSEAGMRDPQSWAAFVTIGGFAEF